MACMAPSTAAAPPMSAFIVSMAFAGLRDRPPESNVIPLPASTSVFSAPGGEYSSRTSLGGCAEPWPTPMIPPYPPSVLVLVQHGDRQAAVGGDLVGHVGKLRGNQVGRAGVDQVPDQRHGIRDHLRPAGGVGRVAGGREQREADVRDTF